MNIKTGILAAATVIALAAPAAAMAQSRYDGGGFDRRDDFRQIQRMRELRRTEELRRLRWQREHFRRDYGYRGYDDRGYGDRGYYGR